MELKDYFRLVRRRWWLLSLCALLGLAGASFATARATPVYGSGLTFFLADASGQPVSALIADSAQTRFASYRTLLTSRAVVAQVQQEAGAAAPLLDVDGQAVGGTIFFRVSTQSSSPEGAFAYASAYAQVLPQYIRNFEGSSGGGVSLQVFEAAQFNPTQVSPDPQRNHLIGLGLGLVLGVLAALLLEALDSRVRTPEDLERETGLPLLAKVPLEHRNVDLVLREHPRSQRAEALRQVRANLQFASMEAPIPVLLVTSAVAGEGKTSVAADLALACAQAGQRVVLVEADLRRPRLTEALGLSVQPGLTGVLAGDLSLDEALMAIEPLLEVLVAGRLPARPSEVLASQHVADLLAALATRCDLVIVDSAPVLPVADAVALLPHVDAVVLVSRVGATRGRQVRDAAERLRSFNARLIGLVANGSEKEDSQYYATQGRGRRRGTTAPPMEIPDLVPAEPAPSASTGSPPTPPVTRGNPADHHESAEVLKTPNNGDQAPWSTAPSTEVRTRDQL